MANFKKALDFLLEIEGGKSNDPADRGGATNQGITIGTYARYKGRNVTVEELWNMTDKERDIIYKTFYWDEGNLDLVKDDRIGIMLFDQIVNSGDSRIIKRVQTVLNEKFGQSLKVDGINGPNTSSKINGVDPEDFMTEFMIESEYFYNAIIKNDPSQLKFINGWTRRRSRLWKLITNGLDLMKKVDEEKDSTGNALLEMVKAFVEAFLKMFGKQEDPSDVPTKDTILNKMIKNYPEINSAALERALSFLDNPLVKNRQEFVFVDFTQNARSKRMYVFDLETGKAEQHQVAHGKYSDPDYDGNIDKVGNVPGSGMSSKGAMVFQKSYGRLQGGWSKFDYAIQIEGLEPGINDNVKERAIVFHSGSYVKDIEGSLPGRSLGCFAVEYNVAKKLVSRLSGGVLLYAHY